MKPNHGRLRNEETGAARRPLQWCGLALCLTTLAVWTGCKPETKSVTDINPAGTYALVSVDGNKLPCVVKHEGKDGPTVKSGTFVINADGTCVSKVTFVTPAGTDATREVKATFAREEGKLTMKWEGAGTTLGTVEGDSFTMNNEGMLFAYRKQRPE
jgi:hypothetical protein